MNNKHATHKILSSLLLCALAACGAAPTTSGPAASAPASSGALSLLALPALPAPASVALDARTTGLLILDINSAVCQPNPACTGTVPAIVSLMNKARAATVPVFYSSTGTPAGPSPMLPQVAPQAGEPVVVSRANKFADTDLENILKQRNLRTLVIVGSAANGAVLYSSFHANYKGFTVVVAEDGLSSPAPISTQVAKYQLLNQPGFTNATNTPLTEQRVTLSRGDLITFR
jgi:nicotinamidase-related amidase